MARVLLTGGAGFIGSHLVDALVAKGHDVLVVDNLNPHVHPRKPDYLNPEAEYHFQDLRDDGVIEDALVKASSLRIHCGLGPVRKGNDSYIPIRYMATG